jgi:hypothetical protein
MMETAAVKVAASESAARKVRAATTKVRAAAMETAASEMRAAAAEVCATAMKATATMEAAAHMAAAATGPRHRGRRRCQGNRQRGRAYRFESRHTCFS